MTSRFMHSIGIRDWLLADFPEVLTSQEGQRILRRRAEEVVREFNEYFNPEFCKISGNAKYLEPDLKEIREAYAKRDYLQLGEALEGF